MNSNGLQPIELNSIILIEKNSNELLFKRKIIINR